MSGRARVVALALAGLAIASLLGLTGYLVSRETIALPATSLSAGEGLAPTTDAARTGTAERVRPAATTARGETGTTVETEADDRAEPAETDGDRGGRGRGRGRGGDDSRSGSGSDGDTSGGSGRGRGRGGRDD